MSLLNNIRKAGTKKQRVKALLTGAEETGKSTSVLYSAERPLLVFDLEDGNEIYSHAVEPFDVYPSNNPEEILAVVEEMIAFKNQGGQIPYNSIFIDSGTDLYKKIINNEIKKLQIDQGKPNKRQLEPKEYGYPNSVFYDIIKGFKSLDVDFYVAAHAADNYLKGAFMQVDPNNPVKADCHKDLAHEMDVHIIFKKIGKGRNIKAEIKKSRLDDKDGNPLLPPVMEKVDNKTFIKTIRELAQRDKGFEREKPVTSNVIQTDAELSNMVEEIINIALNQLQMSNERAVAALQHYTEGKVSAPQQLNKEQAQVVLNAFRSMREQASNSGQTGE